MSQRAGENKQTYYRSERFFRIGADYYFATREGVDIGPYKTREAAERGADLFIKSMQNEQTAGIYAHKLALQGVWASTLYH